jgi:hypothetical protein
MFAMPIAMHKQLSLITLKCAILLCKKTIYLELELDSKFLYAWNQK